MKQAFKLVLTIIAVSGSVLADDSIDLNDDSTCTAPTITNCPTDTLEANHCNVLEYQFEADPGGIGGNANIYWEKVFGYGEIDSTTGLFTFGPKNPQTWLEIIKVVNDCNPPLADTCWFSVRTETSNAPSSKYVDDGLPRDPTRSWYVFGPADAESVAVWIETTGSTHELEAIGIKFLPASRTNIYSARIAVPQLNQLRALPTVVRATPMSRGSRMNSIGMHLSPTSPEIDSSSAYFFADSARSLYGVDGSGVIIGIIDQEIDPTNDDFYFGLYDYFDQ